ncbi:MAG TPA: IS3 family transposase [Candidatus Limnocylindrales bacterium]|nr:IS3 family transposase [Candidatus Limnocylindrales bacterium]
MARPDPEVVAKAKRRRFTGDYKRRILMEADAAKATGDLGSLLRREHLYSSLLVTWRRERDAGIVKGLTPSKRGPKSKQNPLDAEVSHLRRQNARLTEDLRKAAIVIDVQKKLGNAAGEPSQSRNGREARMNAALHLASTVGVQSACEALGLVRASFYRQRPLLGPTEQANPLRSDAIEAIEPTASPRALSSSERETVLACLHSERFQDRSPAAVYATLLDEGVYHCSLRTMYRLLEEEGESGERRDQLTHPAYQKPELLATEPNQLWSWDITKLMGAAKWTYYYLYVIMDVYSRYIVGWMVAPRETAELAKRLIEDTCHKQNIGRDQLTIHADRGSSMTSKPVAFLLADLGVTKTHSRPHVSDDNPYSESQFRTMKYRPEFPDRFGSIQDSRAFCQTFFAWYNDEHRHSGLGLLTPAMVHHGQAPLILAQRQNVLNAAFLAHPERFVRFAPKPSPLPKEVWINKPPASVNNTQ